MSGMHNILLPINRKGVTLHHDDLMMSGLPPRKRYTNDEVSILIKKYSHTYVATHYGISPKRISAISKGIIPLDQGRPPIFQQNHKEYIAQQAFADPKASSERIAQMFFSKFNLKIGRSSVCKILNDKGFKYSPPLELQYLTEEHKLIRYNFSCELLEKYSDEKNTFWNSLVFSDKSRFSSVPDNYKTWELNCDF